MTVLRLQILVVIQIFITNLLKFVPDAQIEQMICKDFSNVLFQEDLDALYGIKRMQTANSNKPSILTTHYFIEVQKFRIWPYQRTAIKSAVKMFACFSHKCHMPCVWQFNWFIAADISFGYST